MVRSPRPAVLALAAALTAVAASAPARAEGTGGPTSRAESDRDPRNWPTVTRLVADRYELAGQVLSVRVHARPTDYFNCGYRHTRDRLMAFTLLGGPLETLTGYMPRDLGKVLSRELENDPWTPITVEVRFDPEKLSDLCPDQVDVLKWSVGWDYPPGTLSPGRADPAAQPGEDALAATSRDPVWKALTATRKKQDEGPTEESLLGDVVELTAGARLVTAYSCAFRGAARSHYAIRLHDARGAFVDAYLRRDEDSRRLADDLALHRDALLRVQGRVVQQVPSNYCRPQIQVTGWSFPR